MEPTPLKPCPICRKPASLAYLPFCSKRCADVDLGRWFGEGYRVATNERPEPSDEMDWE